MIIALIAGVSILILAAGIQAGTEVQDVIKMENAKYESHDKGICMFSHKLHMEDYATANPDLYKNGCGECHHDDEGKPLALKLGDDVQGCIECHSAPGRKPKDEKLEKAEKVMKYHAEAIHENCKSCHSKYNKAKGLKGKDEGAAPIGCSKVCHPKEG